MPDTTPDAVETATPDAAKPAVSAKRTKSNGEITAAAVAKIFDIPEADVLSFRDYGHSLTVVTTEGAKLTKPLA